jgi:hypothetical protein
MCVVRTGEDAGHGAGASPSGMVGCRSLGCGVPVCPGGARRRRPEQKVSMDLEVVPVSFGVDLVPVRGTG